MPRLAKPAQGKYADFARSVRALREGAGLSVQDLSDASGVPPSSIYASESGTRLPTEDNFTAMAPALGIDAAAAAELRRTAFADALFARETYPTPPTGPATLETHADLAAYLMSLRGRAGAWPLRMLGRQVDASPSSLSRVFQGTVLPSQGLLGSLLKVFDATEAEQAEVWECWRRLRGERGSRPTTQMLALLFGTAVSCAYPGCTVPLVRGEGEQSNLAVEIAHIEPIVDAPYSDQFDNLILLCPNHHRSRGDASPEDLRNWKADQAARAREAAQPHSPIQGTSPSKSLPSAFDGELSNGFGEFHQRWKALYLAYAELHLSHLTDAIELVDQVFVKIFTEWGRLLLTDNVHRESFDILASSVMDVMRHKTGKTRLETSRTAIRQNAEHDLIAKIAELPHRQYNVLVLRLYLSCSVEETASVMGLNEQTVRYHERSAERRLGTECEAFVDQGTADR
ncbi:helix-turn-helix domain-containing protein [Streptomyces sp. NPDC048508]|uniref:helix-turn-helix domain-containing protein n=1 Tax=Streptomyces sp. NPDC048508 TaxID=3365561 RepID=UPI00371347FE